MEQVKIFAESGNVEKKANAWLKEMGDKIVITSRIFTDGNSGFYILAIFYEEVGQPRDEGPYRTPGDQ